MKSSWLGASTLLLAALLPALPANAQTADELADLRRQLRELQAEQERTAERINALQTALDRATQSPTATVAPATTPSSTAGVSAMAGSGGLPAPAAAASPTPSRLDLSGDIRLRYEANFGDEGARDRDRGVLRARLRGTYAVNDWLTVGGQIATGDPDDPNSTDITLSNFADDLQVSLDQAYVRGEIGGLQVFGGKMPLPFVRTDLVWDGDVSPQGASAIYRMPLAGGAVRANVLYFLVDESVAGPDSEMVGGQLGIETSPTAPWRFELAASYYDYSLRSLAGGDAGDFRSNLFVNGRYLSDFNLFDVIGSITYQGLGAAWPVRVVGDYVKNFGAATDADTGFGADLIIGRASDQGDWRFTYGYAEAEADAVLAAFSQDNTNLGTNYRQHMLAIDHVVAPNLILNATFYRYRPKSLLIAGGTGRSDWLDRLRLNLLINF